MANFQLPDDKSFTAAVDVGKDAAGNPAIVDGPPTWSTDSPAILALTPDYRRKIVHRQARNAAGQHPQRGQIPDRHSRRERDGRRGDDRSWTSTMIRVLVLACAFALVPAQVKADHKTNAEAALALALALHKKPTVPAVDPTPAPTTKCTFCGSGCQCQNCGCDAYHNKAGNAGTPPTFGSIPWNYFPYNAYQGYSSGGCANGQCEVPQTRGFRLKK